MTAGSTPRHRPLPGPTAPCAVAHRVPAAPARVATAMRLHVLAYNRRGAQRSRADAGTRSLARGNPMIRARPSGRSQSRANSGGIACTVTDCAASASRSRSSCIGRKRVSIRSPWRRMPSDAAASRRRPSARGPIAGSARSSDHAGLIFPSTLGRRRGSARVPPVPSVGAAPSVEPSMSPPSAISANFTA
jgi:hypothetical protein